MWWSIGRAVGSQRGIAGVVLAVALTGAACDKGRLPTSPDAGQLRVSVSMTGDDLETGDLEVVVDEVEGTPLMPGAVVVLRPTTGAHTVGLAKVASNCTVTGSNPRRVEVDPTLTTEVAFDVVCRGTGVTIRARTTGVDQPLSYVAVVDSQAPRDLSPTGAITVSRLAAGTHTIALLVPDQCVATPSDRVTVDVSAMTYVDVAFDVTCTTAAPGDTIPVRREKIAYVDDSDPLRSWIVIVNADGSAPRPLAVGDAPAWSRDGAALLYVDKRCAFASPSECGPVLTLLDPELGRARALLSDDEEVRQADMSPTRDEIVFDHRRYGDDFSSLSTLDLSKPYAAPIPLSLIPSSASQPSWSPDGERIAFVCRWANGTDDLCVINRDGTGLATLVADEQNDGRPTWSPDGRTLAFTRFAGAQPGKPDIALLDLATGVITSLGFGMDPAWSPDGSKLVFSGGDGLYVVNTDGSGLRRLTRGAHRAPAWRR